MSCLRFAALAAVMGFMSMVGAFAAVAVFTESKPVQAEGENNVVKATEFQLTDGQGNPRGVWGVTDDGMVLFSLLDKKGKPRLTMGNDNKSGSVITFNDHNGKKRMMQAVLPDGKSIMTYFHPDGETTAFQVSSTGEGESSLIMNDKSQKNCVFATVQADGNAMLALKHADVFGFTAMLDEKGQSNLVMNDSTQKNALVATVMSDGRTVFALKNDGNVRFRTMLQGDGEPEMGFLTKNAKGQLQYTWQAGNK